MPSSKPQPGQGWIELFRLITQHFPYCIMYQVRVEQGAVVSWEEMQQTFVFGRGIRPPRCLRPQGWEDHWDQLARCCEDLKGGTLKEIHFTEGRPVLAKWLNGGGTVKQLAITNGLYPSTPGGDEKANRKLS